MIQNSYKILEQFIQIAYKIAKILLFFAIFWAKSMKILRRVELANIKILRRVELTFLKKFQKSGWINFSPKKHEVELTLIHSVKGGAIKSISPVNIIYLNIILPK